MRKPPLLSLSVKAGLVLFLVVAGALAIVYAAVVPQLEDRLVNAKIRELEETVQVAARDMRGVDTFTAQNLAMARGEGFGVRVSVLQQVTEGQLQNLADSRINNVGDLSVDPVALEAANSGLATSGRADRDGEQYAEAAFPVDQNRVVLVSAPLDDALANVNLVRRSLLVAGGVALAISWLVGYLIAWFFTRRIRRLESAAERLADGDFETPVRDSGRDEVGQLADAFDSMRSRLAVLDRARGEFIANASHELRTPLFSLGGFVELMDDEDMDPAVRRDFLAEMRDQIDRLTRLATDLLDLSRLDAGQLEVEIAPFDLSRGRPAGDRGVPRGGRGRRPRAHDRRGRSGLRARRRRPRAADRPRVRGERDPAHASRHAGPGLRRRTGGPRGARGRGRRARASRRRTRSISSSASTVPRAARHRGAGSGLRSRRSSHPAWMRRSRCNPCPDAPFSR